MGEHLPAVQVDLRLRVCHRPPRIHRSHPARRRSRLSRSTSHFILMHFSLRNSYSRGTAAPAAPEAPVVPLVPWGLEALRAQSALVDLSVLVRPEHPEAGREKKTVRMCRKIKTRCHAEVGSEIKSREMLELEKQKASRGTFN